MSTYQWRLIDEYSPEHCVAWSHPASGLRALLVLDSLRLGPAAGGIRIRSYASTSEALLDALQLARAMTLKCALGGLEAGGGKLVVMAHDGLDRPTAYREIGRRVQSLGGLFRTAGDLGTTPDDLAMVAQETEFVHLDEPGLASSVARGLLRCVEACAQVRGRPLAGLSVAVQGAGAIGKAVAAVLVDAGLSVRVADLDLARARQVAESVGATVVDPATVLLEKVDVVAPCAVGGVIDPDMAERLSAWAVCGAANNVLTGPEAAEVLRRRNVLHVPDPIASAGAAIDGIGATVMKLDDRTPLIDRLGETAREVLERAESQGLTPSAVTESMARRRLEGLA